MSFPDDSSHDQSSIYYDSDVPEYNQGQWDEDSDEYPDQFYDYYHNDPFVSRRLDFDNPSEE